MTSRQLLPSQRRRYACCSAVSVIADLMRFVLGLRVLDNAWLNMSKETDLCSERFSRKGRHQPIFLMSNERTQDSPLTGINDGTLNQAYPPHEGFSILSGTRASGKARFLLQRKVAEGSYTHRRRMDKLPPSRRPGRFGSPKATVTV